MYFRRKKKEERKKTIVSFPHRLRTAGYSPPLEGWAFVGDEGSGGFFGRRKKKEKRGKKNERSIIPPSSKNLLTF